MVRRCLLLLFWPVAAHGLASIKPHAVSVMKYIVLVLTATLSKAVLLCRCCLINFTEEELYLLLAALGPDGRPLECQEVKLLLLLHSVNISSWTC